MGACVCILWKYNYCGSVYHRQKPWKGTMFSSLSFQEPPARIHSAHNITILLE